MKALRTEIEINAAPERVWQLLTDFPRLPEWNPFMRRASGKVEQGEKITVYLEPPEGMAMEFKPTLTKVQPNRELRWLGHLFFPGLFDGEHYFEIEAISPNQVRLVHGEQFTGILTSLLLRFIGESTLNGFEAMNEALKSEAEKQDA